MTSYYTRYATRSPCGTLSEHPNLTILLTATVRYRCRYCREFSLSARDEISRGPRSDREEEKCSEKGEKEGRLGINDRRAEGGSDESTAHLANVPGRSSRGNKRCSECRYPVMDLERRTDREGTHMRCFYYRE